jgi:threonine/homoserine/homoserine lactone efflux protein
MFVWSSLAHIIALTSPGPDTAIIIRQVSLHGRRSGILAALGIGVGIYIHCLLAIN